MSAPMLPPPCSAPRRVAWALAAVAALAAGSAVAAGVAPIEPSLVVTVSPAATTADMQVFIVRAEPRGGETIATVHLDIVEGHVELMGRKLFFNLQPDSAAMFTLRISRDEPADPLVRIRQEGRVSRAYELRLPVERR